MARGAASPHKSVPGRPRPDRGPGRSDRPSGSGSSAAKPAKARPRAPQARAPSAPRAGTIALVGRPNVGKSTLLNAMLGSRLAITSHHPQTTRDRIAGILTEEATQYVFIDTPGVHAARTRLGKRMNDLATGSAADADVVLFVTDVGPVLAAGIRPEDAAAFAAVPSQKPVVLVINKIDRVKEKQKLFDVLEAYAKLHDFAALVPISAKKNDGMTRLFEVINGLLPEGPALYPEDDISDKPVRFFIAELVREQVLHRTREEVPHGVAVTVDAFEEGKKLTRVTLSVHVAKDSHKGIIIGQGGKMLTQIGSAARERAEKLLGQKVHLDIRVKATPGWFDNAARLIDMGYGDEGVQKPKRKQAAKAARPRTTKSEEATKAVAEASREVASKKDKSER